MVHIIRLLFWTTVERKTLLQKNKRNTEILITFITFVLLYFNGLNYQWRIQLRRSGLAEGYTMRPCTVLSDLTSPDQYSPLLKLWTFSFVTGVLQAKGHFHRLSVSHQHLGDDSTAMWEGRRIQSAQTADKRHPLQGLVTATSVTMLLESSAQRTAESKRILNKTVGSCTFYVTVVYSVDLHNLLRW